jgi:flavin reductase (DIM6/NTAB) family NADH-FMN oxidoreductase RutF
MGLTAGETATEVGQAGALASAGRALRTAESAIDGQYPRVVGGTDLRTIMSHFPTGVTIVTAHADGVDQGMTANSVASVSLAPPLIAVCTSKLSRTVAAINASGSFAVSFLAAHQKDVAHRFSRPRDDHFKGFSTGRTTLGHPYILQGLGYIECDVVQQVDAGDHSVLIGRVTESAFRGGDPLVFFRSTLGQLSQPESAWATSKSKEKHQ